jgi:class 3 adenylate cyclase
MSSAVSNPRVVPSRLSDVRVLALMILALLVGLPVAVWLDLTNLAQADLRLQADDINSLISSVRAYYASNVVGRVLAAPPGTSTAVIADYKALPGAIPIPATLSLELGEVVRERHLGIGYRFVSDYPFVGRAPHVLDDFERSALAALRADPSTKPSDSRHGLTTDSVRVVEPIIMGPACVACHDADPRSPKRDWKVGDVRGIQEVTISQRIGPNLWSFKYLLIYLAATAALGFAIIRHQGRQSEVIRGVNGELRGANDFLASLSEQIAKYLPPQVYQSIFSRDVDPTVHTERKPLTIFFSDIANFTQATERLQPEVITRLLNEYFTAMSEIAQAHGGTLDKFIGDGILIFFGDPESMGRSEDARACLRMAVDMQRRLAALNAQWRRDGVENPFRARMGIHTGYCNVGNFGSADRMQYTVIGPEANLAARLQSVARPGEIVISYETYCEARDIVVARASAPVRVKGIAREITPYTVEGLIDSEGKRIEVFSAHMTGVDFYLDPGMLDPLSAIELGAVLRRALRALENPKTSPAGG